MNLRQKLIIIIILSTVPIFITIQTWQYFQSEEHVTNDVLNHLDSLAMIQEHRVEEAIDRNLDRLNGITSRTQLGTSLDNFIQEENLSDKQKIESILFDAKASIEDIQEIFIINNDGNAIISTNEKILGKNFVGKEQFVNGFHENSLFIITEDGKDVLCLTGPLMFDGKHLGVLVVELSLNSILKITTDYSSLGHTGETFMAKLNENGDALFITPLRFDSESFMQKTISKDRSNVPITQALLGVEDTFSNTIDYRNEPVLSATRFIEKTNWGLVVKIDKSEAYHSVSEIRSIALVGISSVSVLAIISSLYFSRLISSPISHLQQITRNISKGKYDNPIQMSSTDEIGKLAYDIDEMQKTLKKNQEDIIKTTKFTAIGELSSRIAHDLRNPLNVIKNSVELMEYHNRDTLDEHKKRQFDLIHRAIERMEHQITDVLDFVRSRPIIYNKCDLLDIVNLAVSSLTIPLDVRLQLPQKGIDVFCDEKQILIVLTNLIQNAIHAVGNSGEIIIRLYQQESEAIIEIEDSGMGIPNDKINQIFDPLYTTKSEGTGLGLTSCKNIIENHKGKLLVRNNPTTFTIKIPLETSIPNEIKHF